jgi:hypothetical protein
MTPTPTVGEVRAVRIGPQLADVLAELAYRRGPGARRLAIPVPAAAAWALQKNSPVPPG